MSRTHRCDECDNVTEDPIEVSYWVDDDGDDTWNEWHLCSWSCLASFGMTQHLDAT